MGFEWLSKKNYKRHYICLKCQKGFKRASDEDMKFSKNTDLSNLMQDYYISEEKKDIVKYVNAAFKKLNITCPNCKNKMLQVHYDFEIPSQHDHSSWKGIKKTMSHKLKINYDVFIQWHLLELNKVAANSSKFKILKQNLQKLESVNIL
ncbi:hypothetical protein [Polaribacter sp.]|uniref:hypothetical protein n=1 Tax=Polaribacter sp. TaxID=1920175 RepID=UPI003EF6001E